MYLLPPSPKTFKLRVPGYKSNELWNLVWSPDGTQIACVITSLYDDSKRITILDQRRGLLRFRSHSDDDDDDDDNNNNEIGYDCSRNILRYPS